MPGASRDQRQLAQPQRQACQHAVAGRVCADQRQAAQSVEPRQAPLLVALGRQAHRQLYIVQGSSESAGKIQVFPASTEWCVSWAVHRETRKAGRNAACSDVTMP